MPTYEYACTSCGEHVEVVQSFRDDPLSTCPACGGHLRKVFGSIGVVFKGSGFYKTDSRRTSAKGPSSKESATTESPGAAKEPASKSASGSSSDGGSGSSSSEKRASGEKSASGSGSPDKSKPSSAAS